MPGVNFQRTYALAEQYEAVKARASQFLGTYLADPRLFTFDDLAQTLTFTSEQIIPQPFTARGRVLLLFSNPHPHSIQQGMFLAPTSGGQPHQFWADMAESGWLNLPAAPLSSEQLAQTCLRAAYQSPFDLIFHCYYAFPTRYPEHIRRIFGKQFFAQIIQPAAAADLDQIIQLSAPQAILTFNKEIYNLICTQPVARSLVRLNAGELIHSPYHGTSQDLPVYLTYPAGWRYHRAHQALRRACLAAIRAAVSQVR